MQFLKIKAIKCSIFPGLILSISIIFYSSVGFFFSYLCFPAQKYY